MERGLLCDKTIIEGQGSERVLPHKMSGRYELGQFRQLLVMTV